MSTFIKDVIEDLNNKGYNFSNTTFIIPNKRAGLILKRDLSKVLGQTLFSPVITTIEKFTEQISELTPLTNTEILFQFYNTYKSLNKQDKPDDFEVFSKWAITLLQDFNEIDRYLINPSEILKNISEIKAIEKWSLNEPTDLIKRYLQFWNNLLGYYNAFQKSLLKQRKGYQGLIYREAVENIEYFIENIADNQIVFLGFNALNEAESIIIQELIKSNKANIYWDIDQSILDNNYNDAGLFIREFKDNWPIYQNEQFNFITDSFKKQKHVEVFNIPKQIGQVKQVGNILNQLLENNKSLSNTAVVLADETLLIPLLNSLPIGITKVNITMGLPLKDSDLAYLFEQIFTIKSQNDGHFYHRDVLKILTHTYISKLFLNKDLNHITNQIEKDNIASLTLFEINAFLPAYSEVITLFFKKETKPEHAIDNCIKIIHLIKKALQTNKKEHLLELEYLYRFNQLFNELKRLQNNYNAIEDTNALNIIYKNLLARETLDFQGEPLEGLQVMGMLETRVLDFENIILVSVNEGILPSGKRHNSFIPFDVKKDFGLPTFKEKDAIYTYHFYRLLQRAKRIFLLYNSEINGISGGEKSRFISQLEVEGVHKINYKTIAPKVKSVNKKLTQVKKTNDVINRLIEVTEKGFSPSSLASYIRNPIEFYQRKILKIKEHIEVEETVAANTLGTVIHNTLEDLYTPMTGSFLTQEFLKKIKPNVERRVAFHFKEEYKKGDISKGKNLIVFEIAKHYINRFLDLEIEDLKKGNQIKLISLEEEIKVPISIESINYPMSLTGKIDRIDIYNDTLRIIDYKTGKVEQRNLEVINWEEITMDYEKHNKAFQLLCYAFMFLKKEKSINALETGIISFKNLQQGFIKFAKKEALGSRKKETLVTREALINFEIQLKKLIQEIYNTEINFIEKEV